MLVGVCWPAVVLLAVAIAFVSYELAQDVFENDPTLVAPRGSRAAVRAGLEHSLPTVLILSFVTVPSTATLVFNCFLCDRIDYNDAANATTSTFRRYLHSDLAISCDDARYDGLRDTAVLFVFIIPVGIPLLYISLLWACRDALKTGNETPLSRAIAFLSADYKVERSQVALLWEPFEMCRKLTLVGFVLLIGEESDQARVLVALFVCTTFLALQMGVKPFKRDVDSTLMITIQLALILTYVCILVIKACHTSVDVCKAFGFGDNADGVFLFFILFGISMLLLLLLVSAINLYAAGSVPLILVVATAHGVSPWSILQTVFARRLRYLKHLVFHILRFDVPRLTPGTVAAILKFRTAAALYPSSPAEDTPTALVPLAIGVVAECFMPNVFPNTKCFVQVDLEVFAIRWTRRWLLSLSTVEDINLIDTAKKHRSSMMPSKLLTVEVNRAQVNTAPHGSADRDPKSVVGPQWVATTVQVRYSGHGGVSRLLELSMPAQNARAWVNGLQEVCKAIPAVASAAQSRWVLTCMASTSKRGASGFLHRAELRSLLVFANASPDLSSETLTDAMLSIKDLEQHFKLPTCFTSTSPGGAQQQLLNARQVTWLLLQLCTSSPRITEQYDLAAVRDGLLGLSEWLSFIRTEQLAPRSVGFSSPEDDADMELAQRCFDQRCADFGSEQRLTPLQFALLLLSPENDAAAPARRPGATDDIHAPLSQYWTSSSHNSYVVGDQLAGLSTALVYRRQLLQQVRHLEIDCWDGPYGSPLVTHGHTLCTRVSFDDVAKAVGECAFLASELEVSLSLEMHCSPAQQRKIAKMAVKHFGLALLPYAELVAFGRATSLSPLDLVRRILLKGKIKLLKKESSKLLRRSCLRFSRKQSDIAQSSSRKKQHTSFTAVSSNSASSDTGTEDKDNKLSRHSTADIDEKHGNLLHCASSMSDYSECGHENKKDAKARPCSALLGRCTLEIDKEHGVLQRHESFGSSGGGRTSSSSEFALNATERANSHLRKSYEKSKRSNDEMYASFLTLRAVPFSAFLAAAPSNWALPVTSISEDRLLKHMGLQKADRKLLEGLQVAVRTSSASLGDGLTEEQLSARTIARLAADPPHETGRMQQLTTQKLLRPYPLGIRFSGKNMNPMPCWLAGAQFACLNFSPIDARIDLAMQLHFALFAGSQGFLLKPYDMREPARSGYASDAREEIDAPGRGFGTDHDDEPHRDDDIEDRYWPLLREEIHRTTVDVLSMHNLPKRGEQRPVSRNAAHKYHPELSGASAPPNNQDQSNPCLKLSLHPIGGFCAISTKLPLLSDVTTELTTHTIRANGMNARLEHTVHCFAAEAHATFLRIGIFDRENEVAYTAVVLGRLRQGYRVLQLRSLLGLRIELAHLFVRVRVGSEQHVHLSPRQIRLQARLSPYAMRRISSMAEVNDKLKRELQEVRSSFCRDSAGSVGDAHPFRP